jgi:twitching motility protein PilI
LREFQAQLVERMQAAQRGGFSKLSQLGIIIGQQRYLLDLREAGEIVSATLLTNVPLTKDWYVGLSNIRGNLTSVVDLSRFQGFELTKLDNSCRIVGFAPALGFNSGLLVSQVLGLRNLAEMEEIASGETDGIVRNGCKDGFVTVMVMCGMNLAWLRWCRIRIFCI